MAKMIPPRCDEDAPDSEKRVFRCLAEDPGTDGWTVLHSLGLARQRSGQYGEIDFVVIVPREGIVCLEVKGGGVSCRNGVWRSEDRHGHVHELKKSPFRQVQEAMFALGDAIKRRCGAHAAESRCPMGYAVVFPDVRELPQTPEFERSDVIYAQDLQAVSAAIGRLVKNRLRPRQPSGGPQHPEPQEVKAILNALRPEFDLVPARSVNIERAEEKLLSLTEEQYDRLDELEDNPRCVFKGAAGTGKTLLAVEYARRRARAGKRVLFVCYNRLLGAWIEEQLRETEVTVGTWHRVLRQIIRASGAAEEFLARERELFGSRDPNAAGVLWDEVYPQHAEAALLERDEPPFDVIVVDEAQDLIVRQEFLPLLDLAVRGGLAGGRWTMFGDFTRQALVDGGDGDGDPATALRAYGRRDDDDGRLGLQFVPLRLRRNCRNTRSIAEATAAIGDFEAPPCRSGADVGAPVEYHFWSGARPWQDILAEVLERLLKTDGVPVEDVMLLAPGRSERDTLTQLGRVAGRRIVDSAAGAPSDGGSIRVTTIHAFKGMESPVVIIPGLDRELEEWKKPLLYVGMSRARSLLVLIAHQKARKALLRRIGGAASGEGE